MSDVGRVTGIELPLHGVGIDQIGVAFKLNHEVKVLVPEPFGPAITDRVGTLPDGDGREDQQ